MFKKNLLGIVIVLLVFAGFYAGYSLGKSSGASKSGMRSGAPGGKQSPSTPNPASQGEGTPQGKPEIKPSGDAHWVKKQQGKDDIAPEPTVKNVAWAKPLDTAQSGEQSPENMRQSKKRRPGMDGTTPQQRPQGRRSMPVTQEERETPDLKTADLDETSKRTSSQIFYGTVVPYAEAKVQSKQGGTITMLKGKEGDVVEQGEVIVRFDDRDTQLQLQQALASKNSAVEQVRQAQSNFQTIQTNVKRYQELFDDGFVSKQQVDDLQNQLTSAMSSLNSAKESVKQNEVQVKMIENTLADFQVKAPISGIINLKNYNLSEVYQGGGVIYHLIDIEQVYVEVEIPETYLKQVREGIAVNVMLDAVGEQRFSGILETILPSGTADNRSFIAKVMVQNSDFSIKPGMFARVEISNSSSI